jgi:AcrR family transcriptional regulator
MKQKTKSRPAGDPVIWERPPPALRPAPEPLSRDSIVRAALAIADRSGLAAVSLRRTAAALKAGPMRLYGYVATKEDLLELMVDAVFAEMESTQPVNPDWKQGLRSIADRTRRTALRHPWLVDLLGGRPHQGPHALAYLEETLATLNQPSAFQDIDAVLLAARTVNAYVIGAIRSEISELRATVASGLNKEEWQATTGPYLQRMIATGRFPTLEEVMRDATHPSADVVFDTGLRYVLEGIEAQFSHLRKDG